jgi:nucleotide-binding universal stress UspA family protein
MRRGARHGRTTKEENVQTILVAYDDTPPSKRALERAVELADHYGAQLLITSVARLSHSTPRSIGQVDRADSLGEHSQELQDAQAYATERGVTPEVIAVSGEPAQAIARLADDRDVDLVVVGTREPGLVDRIMRPSVSQEIAKRIRHDLLIVHPEH